MPRIFSNSTATSPGEADPAAVPPSTAPNGRVPTARSRAAGLIGFQAGRPSNLLLALACGLAFGALAILVSLGTLAGIDQWSVEHLMPAVAAEHGGNRSPLSQVLPVFHPFGQHQHFVLAAVTYSLVFWASLAPSLVFTLVAVLYLRRVGRQRVGWALALAFGVFNLVDYVVKAVITRPHLYVYPHRHFHIGAFDSSFPSGHAGRAVILTVCLAACYPRARGVMGLWLTSVLVFLVVGAWHTPSDVLGGVLLAVGLCLASKEFAERRPPPSHPRVGGSNPPRAHRENRAETPSLGTGVSRIHPAS